MKRRPRHRSGSVTIAVLGVSVIVAIMGVGGLVAAHAQRRLIETAVDARRAQALARSAVELARIAIASDPNWRSNLKHNQWSDPLSVGGGSVRWKIVDEADGDPSNNTVDPIRLYGLGTRAGSTQVCSVMLTPQRTAYSALAAAIHVAGQLRTRSGKTLSLGSAVASSNGTIRNDGAITGSTESLLYIGSGTVSGTKTIAATAKAFPPSSVISTYTARGTPISPGNTIEKCVLSPGSNPWGATNPNGVYVWNANSNLTIRDCRIVGTLVINAPGRTVDIDRNVLIQPARADYPALIINANADFKFTSTSELLSEPDVGVNFNPASTPYAAASDADTLDSYPSEVQGLVHITGTFTASGNARVRGLILVESGALTDAADITSSFEIIYNASLFSSPPDGYAAASSLIVAPASWRREPAP